MTVAQDAELATLAGHAVDYAAAGLEIFPVNPTDKTPLISQYKATTDTEVVANLWKRWPGALIGHRLPPDQVITDIDPRHGGHDTWQALKAELGDTLPVTRVHASGREDGGGHLWWIRPAERLTVTNLDRWAEEHNVGQAVETGPDTALRWVSGIDLLHHKHRYTILPPSPHPETGQPYRWLDGRGLDITPAPLPALLADLLTPDLPPAPPAPARDPDPDSIADWWSNTTSWTELLPRHGWALIAGDGNSDGSRWRHPRATAAYSATIRHGCLFVYSPNTPFTVTAPDQPHGYTPFRAWAVLEHRGDLAAAARTARETKDGSDGMARVSARVDEWMRNVEQGNKDATEKAAEPAVSLSPPHPHPGLVPIHWPDFWAQDRPGEDWLIEPLLPRGRQVALWATHKTGKSLLTLEIAAALATGRPCLASPPQPPTPVIYCDMEMTEDDVHERLADLGYGPEVDLSRLHYYLLPALPPLDKPEGGLVMVELAAHHQAAAVILDTMSRVVTGEENDADTYRAFYRCTGIHLKAMGVSVLRLDHGGKDPARGQRGSSSKGDDLDVVWQLKPADNGVRLVRDLTRVPWIPEDVALVREEDPLRHRITTGLWPAGMNRVVKALDRFNLPLDITQREAARTLRDHHETARNNVLRAALKWRRQQQAQAEAEQAEAWMDEVEGDKTREE